MITDNYSGIIIYILLLEERKGLQVIGDKGYVSEDLEKRLWEEGEHLLGHCSKISIRGVGVL